jgi:hypothetical protein
MDIDGYSISGYYICEYPIDGYFVSGCWWLLMVIVLVIIGEYSISGY